MSRYVDAKWLLNFVAIVPDNYTITVGNFKALINDAPSIDIVYCDGAVSTDIDCFDTCKHAYSEVCDECYKSNKYEAVERSE